MENAKTYILSKLKEVIKIVSSIKILYKYDSFSKEHLIKVFPSLEYNKNEKYQEIEGEIIFDFINKYPNDSLVFFTEDDWIDIVKPDEIFQGLNYKENNIQQFSCSENLLLFRSEDDIFNISGILEDYQKRIFYNKINTFKINSSNESLFLLNNLSDNCIFNENNKLNKTIDLSLSTVNEDNLCTTDYDCINFALAA